MNKKAAFGVGALIIGLVLAGPSWDAAATPAIPGGGNPNAKSDNAATPAVPAGGNNKDKEIGRAHV